MHLNKPVCLELPILELSKIAMYEFWYDYIKPKYEEKAKMCYVDTESFIVYIKVDGIHKDVGEDFEVRFDASNYELEAKGENKKLIGLMKDELCGNLMKEFFGLRAN